MTHQNNKQGFGTVEWVMLIALLALGAILAVTFVGGPAKQKLLSVEEKLQPATEDAAESLPNTLPPPENSKPINDSAKQPPVTEQETTPSKQTELTKSPSFDTKYLKDITDDITQFSVVITPTDLVSEIVTGVEVELATRGYTLPAVTSGSVNLNEDGWYQSDWKCNTIGDTFRCSGQDVLREGTRSTVGLNFSGSIDSPPPFLSIKLLGPDETTVVGIGVEYKPGE